MDASGQSPLTQSLQLVKVIGITQARLGSSRLPGKVLMQVAGKPMLAMHLQRLLQSKNVQQWWVATTHEPGIEALLQVVQSAGVSYFQGSLDDVLDRFYQTASPLQPDYVVRVTSDCPLIDPQLIDEVVQRCIAHGWAYDTNTWFETFPDGLDVEVFTFAALKDAWLHSTERFDREHVTPYIRRKYPEAAAVSTPPSPYAKVRLTLDEPADFERLKHIIETLGDQQTWMAYAEFLAADKLAPYTATLTRNIGSMKSAIDQIQLRHIDQFPQSDAYRAAIHQLIPGGCHTYSKGDDQFPALAPAAIVSGKGSQLWDVDGHQYLDCSMGLTSVSLGHAYPEVLEAVKSALDQGVNFQRPSYLERLTAEKFLQFVPGHDRIKFAKNGSAVTTAAVKLARAKTGRKLVAFPSDHPFYSFDDWFIGQTACNRGVPEEIAALSVTFKGCNIASLEQLFAQYPDQIACVITEPERSNCFGLCACELDRKAYLQAAIDLCHAHGALFISDEMVTGFKSDFPGSITRMGLVPDMATWGKGIANGFSFCALTGKAEVMDLGGITEAGAERVFLISSTHGGETHALAAAMATLDVFSQQPVIAHNHYIGRKLIELSRWAIENAQLSQYIEVSDCEWMPVFVCKDVQQQASMAYRTLLLQEMIKRGVLFQGAFVPCYSHSMDDVYYFVKALQMSLQVYQQALDNGVANYLVGPEVKPVFRKYN